MNTRIAAAGLVILALLAGALAFYITTQRHPATLVQPPAITSNPSTPPSVGITTEPAPKEATIYTVDEAHGDSNGLAPLKVPLTDRNTPARGALEALIGTDNSPIPSGTRLLGIKIDGGLATVDFSSEFQKNFHGGDEQEAQAVNSVLMTLGQFHTVDRVQFLVQGSAIDSLGGHFELSDPVDVIRPTDSQQALNE